MSPAKRLDPAVISKAAVVGTKIRGRGLEPALQDDDRNIVRGAILVFHALNSDVTKAAVDGDYWLTRQADHVAALREKQDGATTTVRAALQKRIEVLEEVRVHLKEVRDEMTPFIDQDAYSKMRKAADALAKQDADKAEADAKAAKKAEDEKKATEQAAADAAKAAEVAAAAAKEAADKAVAVKAAAAKEAADKAVAVKAAADKEAADKAAAAVVAGGAPPTGTDTPTA